MDALKQRFSGEYKGDRRHVQAWETKIIQQSAQSRVISRLELYSELSRELTGWWASAWATSDSPGTGKVYGVMSLAWLLAKDIGDTELEDELDFVKEIITQRLVMILVEARTHGSEEWIRYHRGWPDNLTQ